MDYESEDLLCKGPHALRRSANLYRLTSLTSIVGTPGNRLLAWNCGVEAQYKLVFPSSASCGLLCLDHRTMQASPASPLQVRSRVEPIATAAAPRESAQWGQTILHLIWLAYGAAEEFEISGRVPPPRIGLEILVVIIADADRAGV